MATAQCLIIGPHPVS
jgi:hypothetical protein